MATTARAVPVGHPPGTCRAYLQLDPGLPSHLPFTESAGEGRPGKEVVRPLDTAHAIDYRLSLSLFGHRYYLACFVGREQRSAARLIEDDQHKSWLHTAITLSAVVVGISTGLICTLAATYLVKSMVGLDLFEDHFFLHNLFFI